MAAFAEQARGLIEGGVDLLLVETSQDMLEVKAAIAGIRRALDEAGVALPIQAQVTLDTSGRMLLGTDIEAAYVTLEALRVDVVGLNCSTGPEPMRQPVRWLCENSILPVSVIPNAGMPRNVGGVARYDLTPEELAAAHEEFVERLGVSVVGGCCGTTPDHLARVVERVGERAPLSRGATSVAGLERDDGHGPRPGSAAHPDRRAGQQPGIPQGQAPAPRRRLRGDPPGRPRADRGGAHLLDVCVALTERPDEATQMGALVKLLRRVSRRHSPSTRRKPASSGPRSRTVPAARSSIR